jgi:hypothetical protein
MLAQDFQRPRTAFWSILNGEDVRLRVDLFLLCVRGRLTFERRA